MKLDDASRLARKLMFAHGLSSWTFRWDNAVRRFGYCHSNKKLITLSRQLTELNSEVEVRNVILHEIAHALVGPGHWHDKVWKAKAIGIGCTGDRCYDHNTVKKPPRKWTATCGNCGRVAHGHRRHRVSCGTCSNGRFNPNFLMKWRAADQ